MNLTHVKQLQAGNTISFREFGGSMTPKIQSGEKITVAPVTPETEIKKGDVVCCRVKGRLMTHLVTAVSNGRYQISNNHNHVNGWAGRNSIYGKVIKVEP
jgi:hypothetical protein